MIQNVFNAYVHILLEKQRSEIQYRMPFKADSVSPNNTLEQSFEWQRFEGKISIFNSQLNIEASFACCSNQNSTFSIFHSEPWFRSCTSKWKCLTIKMKQSEHTNCIRRESQPIFKNECDYE